MFIARISKGRTIRQFVIYVILVPSLVSFVWFSILGGSAIDLQLNQGWSPPTTDTGGIALEAALFDTLREFPSPVSRWGSRSSWSRSSSSPAPTRRRS